MGEKQQVPSVGRVVHYIVIPPDIQVDITPGRPQESAASEADFAGAHHAAIITEVYPVMMPGPGEPWEATTDRAGLAIFSPIGLAFVRHCPYDPTGTQPGTWHWPEFVPPRAA